MSVLGEVGVCPVVYILSQYFTGICMWDRSCSASPVQQCLWLSTEPFAGWGGKDPLEAIRPTPATAVTPKAGCPAPHSGRSCVSLGRGLHPLSGQPMLVFCHLHSEKSFLVFKGNILSSCLCPLPLVLFPSSRTPLCICWCL